MTQGAGRPGDDDRMRRFTAVAAALHAQGGAPGLTAAFIGPDDQVHATAVGLADTEAGRPMAPDSRMPGGSTGKTIVAAAALSLAAEGVIDLDAPLSCILGGEAWFPRLPNADGLTLRLLMHHTGGLPDHMGLPGTLDFLVANRRANGPEWYCKPREVVGLILDLPPIAAPGAAFFYTDTGYIVLGLALEVASGRTLDQLQRERVLAPLRIEGVEPALGRFHERLAPGYTNAPEGSPLPRKTVGEDGGLVYSPRTEWAGGGMVSSAPGLARFIRAYAGGRLMAQPYLDQLRQFVRFSWSPDQVSGYGLGVFGGASPLGETIGHGGYYPGYQTQMTYFPDHDLAIAYQMNYSASPSAYAAIVDHRVEATRTRIDPDAPLTEVTDWAVKLAAAILDRPLA